MDYTVNVDNGPRNRGLHFLDCGEILTFNLPKIRGQGAFIMKELLCDHVLKRPAYLYHTTGVRHKMWGK